MNTDEPTEITLFELSGACVFDVGAFMITIQPRPGTDRDDVRTREAAGILAGQAAPVTAIAAERIERANKISALHDEITQLKRELALARDRIPPKAPRRVLAPGCVRFDARGRLWLLSKREAGWSAFGVQLEGWDDLFRRFAVRVTEHGRDEHGLWWAVDNTGERTAA